MMNYLRPGLPLLLAILLAGCSGNARFDTENTDLTLTPQQAVSEEALQQDKQVLWGGMIINSTNLKEQTRIEVLAYPLDSDHYPQTDKTPYGRFLLFHDGYLETVDYAPGRLVSVLGRFNGTSRGRVDESEYTYPVVQAEQLHLWPRSERSDSRIHFGIGVMFGR